MHPFLTSGAWLAGLTGLDKKVMFDIKCIHAVSNKHCYCKHICHRAVGRSENPEGGGGASSNVVGTLCPPLEIGLNDLPKSGGAMPPTPSSCVHICFAYFLFTKYEMPIFTRAFQLNHEPRQNLCRIFINLFFSNFVLGSLQTVLNSFIHYVTMPLLRILGD